MTKTVWSILNPMVFIIANMTAPIKAAPVSMESARAVSRENATAVYHMKILRNSDGLSYAQQTLLTMFVAALDAALIIATFMFME